MAPWETRTVERRAIDYHTVMCNNTYNIQYSKSCYSTSCSVNVTAAALVVFSVYKPAGSVE